MIKNIGKLLLVAGAAVVSLVACKRETMWHAEAETSGFQSFVRLIHASPNFRAVLSNPSATPPLVVKDTFNVYAGSAKLNNTIMTYGSQFPASNLYLGIGAGTQTFRYVNPGVLNVDSLTVHSFIKSLDKGQRYSLIITDSMKSANENMQMFIRDNFVQPVPSQFGIRFVHAVVNDTAGKTVDLYSAKLKANMFTNVKIGTATSFQNYNVTGMTGDTLIVRRNGVTTWELARLNAQTYANQRVYTYVYRGDTRATGTKGKSLITYQNL
jgi:hypothetical protein